MKKLTLTIIIILVAFMANAQTATATGNAGELGTIQKEETGFYIQMIVTPKAATKLLVDQIKAKRLPATIKVNGKELTVAGQRGAYTYNGKTYKSLTDVRKPVLADLRGAYNIN